VFVVDDLVGWLIGRLADAGYQKLVTLVRGSDQARALKSAVEAAVAATLVEIGLSDTEAERVGEQINKAFRHREPVPLPAGQPTMLEALQAGIAVQLATLDDAGQPAASLLRVPVSDVAAKLTGHLVYQIQMGGARGGPLAPLAGQLNDDLTHLQGQRVESMVAQVLEMLGAGDGAALPGGVPKVAGWLLADVRDPFALEVHRPVEPDAPLPGLPVLPEYWPRDHDAVLAEVVTAAAAGTSGIAVLVGGSSTGKTRACWEALALLRDVEPGWRLWHPIDPSPGQAVLAGLHAVRPWTVVWLNEAQNYLRSPDGEQVAAALRELVRSPDCGPVLVLATLWPEYWSELTASPATSAGQLLAGHDIPVAPRFTSEQLRGLENAADPRLVQAAAASRDGQVIQYLAGAPDLLDRYRNASPAARALIDAAMDARRLGMGPALPRAFLETAAPGYLTDADLDQLDHDWLDQATRDTEKYRKGVRGPLAPIRPRPAPGAPPGTVDRALWQLADYLDHQGRRIRREEIPPEAFWAAAARHAAPHDLGTLAKAARDRGLYRDAALLYKQGSAHGDPLAGVSLVGLLHAFLPGDHRPPDWAAAHASLDDPYALAMLLRELRKAGGARPVTTLLERDPAAHADLDDPRGVAELLAALREAGAARQVTALASRATAHARIDDPRGVAELLAALHEAGAARQVTTLASRAAAHAGLDDPRGVAELLAALHEAGAAGQVTALLDRDPAAHARIDNARGVAELLAALHEAGAAGQVTALASRAGLDDPHEVANLLRWLRKAGGAAPVTALLDRDPAAHASLDNPYAVTELLAALHEAGAPGQVTALASRAVAHASLDDPHEVANLLRVLLAAGADGQVTALLDRDPAGHASLDDPYPVTELLRALLDAEAAGQVTALLDRDPAAHASLNSSYNVAELLSALREAGAAGQVTALANRATAHASLDDTHAMSQLLNGLLEARADGQASALLDRRAAHASLDNPDEVANLLSDLRVVGADGQVTALLDRDPAAHASLDNPDEVANLLSELRAAGADGQVTALLDRDPAAHASLDNPHPLSDLLRALSKAGATGQVTALASRAAAHASLDHANESSVTQLLVAMDLTGAQAQATALIERLPAAGQFGLFCQQESRAEQFRFGREADGRPAEPWGWTDISA
jgi:hypothetical protein